MAEATNKNKSKQTVNNQHNNKQQTKNWKQTRNKTVSLMSHGTIEQDNN